MPDPAQAATLFLLAGLFFIALTLARTGLGLGLARHPLFAGLLWWLAHGDVMLALPAAVFFELLWLDSFYVGTYVPPQGLLAYLLFLPLALTFNLLYPQETVLLLVLCLPAAMLGARAELWLRARFGGRGYEKLLQVLSLEASPGLPVQAAPQTGDAVLTARIRSAQTADTVQTTLGGIISSAVLIQIMLCLALYGGCALLLFWVVWALGVTSGVWPVGVILNIPVAHVSPMLETWGVYWVLASIGGLLALRIRWALACFVAGALAMAVFLLF